MDMLVGRIWFLAGCWPEASPIPCHMSLSTGSSQRGNLHSSEWARKWEKAWKPEATVSSWPSLRSHISDLLLFSIHENFPQILAHDSLQQRNLKWVHITLCNDWKEVLGRNMFLIVEKEGRRGTVGLWEILGWLLDPMTLWIIRYSGSSQIANCSRPGWPFTPRCDEASVPVLGVRWGPAATAPSTPCLLLLFHKRG